MGRSSATRASRPSAKAPTCALRRAVRKLQRQGAQGLVLDLRGNGGGLLEEAVLTASIFLPEGETVVSTDSRSQGHAVYKTKGGNLPSLPIVVLIDRNTASAAEILTAALADDAGAKTVGTRSYGKGVFQQEIDLSNGGALKLTVGEYFTPDGDQPGRQGHPPRRARPRPAGHGARRGARTGLSGCCRRSEQERRRRDWRVLPGAAARARARAQAGRAEDGPRGGRGAAARGAGRARLPRLARARSGGGGAVAESRERPAPRPDRAADLHRRPGDRARLRRRRLGAARGRGDPALDPHRRRRRPRAAGLAARPRGAAPRQQHLRAGRGRADAAARAQRGGLQPGAGGRAARGDGGDRARRGRAARRSAAFYRSRIRSDARLDYDELDVVFSGRAEAPRGGRRAARGRPRGGGGAGRAARRDQPRRRVLRARVPLRLARARRRRPRRRPDRVAPADRAADDPRQRAGGAAAGAQAGAGDLPGPRPAGSAADRTADRAAARARGPDPAAARDAGAEPRRRSWRRRRAGW